MPVWESQGIEAHDIDGFVTDVPGLMLVTAYADCVPLYFADRRLHVMGSHIPDGAVQSTIWRRLRLISLGANSAARRT